MGCSMPALFSQSTVDKREHSIPSIRIEAENTITFELFATFWTFVDKWPVQTLESLSLSKCKITIVIKMELPNVFFEIN